MSYVLRPSETKTKFLFVITIGCFSALCGFLGVIFISIASILPELWVNLTHPELTIPDLRTSIFDNFDLILPITFWGGTIAIVVALVIIIGRWLHLFVGGRRINYFLLKRFRGNFGNTCQDNDEDGIGLWYSGFATVSNNTCNNNDGEGISLWYSSFSTLSHNICSNNHNGSEFFLSLYLEKIYNAHDSI